MSEMGKAVALLVARIEARNAAANLATAKLYCAAVTSRGGK